MTQSFINKTKYFNRLVKFMQKRMKAKCETIDAKVEVIEAHWGKLLFTWFITAKEENDLGMIKILQEIT